MVTPGAGGLHAARGKPPVGLFDNPQQRAHIVSDNNKNKGEGAKGPKPKHGGSSSQPMPWTALPWMPNFSGPGGAASEARFHLALKARRRRARGLQPHRPQRTDAARPAGHHFTTPPPLPVFCIPSLLGSGAMVKSGVCRW